MPPLDRPTPIANENVIIGAIPTNLGGNAKQMFDVAEVRLRALYGRSNVDGFDFKLNLQSDEPFKGAVPLVQAGRPRVRPLSSSPGGRTRAAAISGRGGRFFGVAVNEPRVVLPPGTPRRREYHLTVLEPGEYASLDAAQRARLASGIDIGGAPRDGEVVEHKIGEFSAWQQQVDWPEAQTFRESLGLDAKDLHVSLTGGVGDAVQKRNKGGKK